MIPALQPIAGVPVALLVALNQRLMLINAAIPDAGAAAAAASGSAIATYGLHAARLGQPISAFPNGSIFIETDQSNIAYQVQGGAWVFAGGILKAAFASAPTGLPAGDAGLLWNVSDYAHLLRWTGTGWEFVDACGGYIEGRVVAPDGNGWQLCDGTATSYLHVAAGVVSAAAFTTPNLTGFPSYPKWAAAYAGSIVAAVAPNVLTFVDQGTGSATAAATLGVNAQPQRLEMLAYFRR